MSFKATNFSYNQMPNKLKRRRLKKKNEYLCEKTLQKMIWRLLTDVPPSTQKRLQLKPAF